MITQLSGQPGCPFAHRVAIALREKGLTCERREGKSTAAWLRPNGWHNLEPTLFIGGHVLFGSAAIVEYLDDQYPDRQIRSSDPGYRAAERTWLALADHMLEELAEMLLAEDRKTFRRAQEAVSESLLHIDRILQTKNWLSDDGDRFGLADVAIAPLLAYIESLVEAGILRFPEDRGDLRQYSRRLTSRPSVSSTCAIDLAGALSMTLTGTYFQSVHRRRTGSGLISASGVRRAQVSTQPPAEKVAKKPRATKISASTYIMVNDEERKKRSNGE